MTRRAEPSFTRAGLLGLGAVAAGGAAIGAKSGGRLLAAPSPESDAKILNFFLLLEYVQEGFYREALQRARLTGALQAFASTVGAQESEHAAFLAKGLGGRARARPQLAFGDVLSTPEQFRAAAIELEEAAIAAYIGQAANLTPRLVGKIGTLLSVEARQAAWVRDLGGVSPAPRAADPARTPDQVLAQLRRQGVIT
jgi:hypothetical protein